MERRKRVENIMNSKIFREELERVVGDKMRDSDGEFGLSALIKVSTYLFVHFEVVLKYEPNSLQYN